jgi:hypothetical protein
MSSPVSVRPISIRWISDVPSKIVKILERMGRVIGIPARPPIAPCGWGYRCPFRRRARFPAQSLPGRTDRRRVVKWWLEGGEHRVSEYQYYEFRTLDRPLTAEQQQRLRALSSRAEISATRLINVYSFGDFRGDPGRLLEEYFDAYLYAANWGTRELAFRLPRHCWTQRRRGDTAMRSTGRG